MSDKGKTTATEGGWVDDRKPTAASAGYSIVAVAVKLQPFITCECSPFHGPQVVFKFQTLEQAQEFHQAVISEIKSHKL